MRTKWHLLSQAQIGRAVMYLTGVRPAAYLPFAVLGFPLELNVPVLSIHLCTVGDGHGNGAKEIQA